MNTLRHMAASNNSRPLLLHRAFLSLALPTAALSFIRVPDVQFRMDPDGKTSRAILQVTASIEIP